MQYFVSQHCSCQKKVSSNIILKVASRETQFVQYIFIQDQFKCCILNLKFLKRNILDLTQFCKTKQDHPKWEIFLDEDLQIKMQQDCQGRVSLLLEALPYVCCAKSRNTQFWELIHTCYWNISEAKKTPNKIFKSWILPAFLDFICEYCCRVVHNKPTSSKCHCVGTELLMNPSECIKIGDFTYFVFWNVW